MKVLFTVHTYFQLLIAMNLKKQFFSGDIVDIVLSDVSAESRKIAKKINKSGYFNSCYYTKVKEYLNCNGTFRKLMKYLKADIMYEKIFRKSSNIPPDASYDILVFYQFDPWTDTLYYHLKKKNPSIECRRMQETFNSYLNEGGLIVYSEFTDKIKNIMRRATGKPIIRHDMTTYYMFDPDMILFKPSSNYSIVKMQKFDNSDSDFMNAVNYIFGYDKLKDKYNQKFIYFESIEHDEFEAIKKIAETVGKGDFMVKIHPRSSSNKYSEAGIQTNSDIAIPWEVILLNKNFDNRVFLTTSSQAVFGFLQFTNHNAKGFLIYKCISAKIDSNLNRYLKKLSKKYGKNKLFIPSNIDELLKYLKTEVKK